MHRSQLGLFAPVMVQAAAEMAERWDALPDGARLDVLREMGTLTAEVICRAVFGPRLGTEHATEIAASFSEYQRLVGRLDLPYLVGLPDWMPRPHSWRIRHAARRIHAVLDHVIRAMPGAARAAAKSSMIRLLLEARDPETGAALDDAVAAQRGRGAVPRRRGDHRQFARLDLVPAVAGARGRGAAACRAGERSRRPPADPG